MPREYQRKPHDERMYERISIPVTQPFMDRLNAVTKAWNMTRTDWCRKVIEEAIEGHETRV